MKRYPRLETFDLKTDICIIKQGQGNFVIKKGSKILYRVSLKARAYELFENLTK